MSSFIYNDNQKIIKILNKLIIIYDKSLKRKKLIYFLQYYNNIIKLISINNSKYYNYLYHENKEFINDKSYSRNNTKLMNSFYQMSNLSTTFCKDLNFILNQKYAKNNIGNKTKQLTKFISLKKKIPTTKLINTNNYIKIPKNKNNNNIQYNSSFNSNLNNDSKKFKWQEDENQNLISMFTKNIKISKLAELSNNHKKNNTTNKRHFSSGNVKRIVPKTEKYTYNPPKYSKYSLNLNHIPSNSESINDFRKIPKRIPTNISNYYNFTNYENNLNDNELYSFSEQFNISASKNNYANYKKINPKNYTHNLNALLRNETIRNNTDLYDNKNYSVISSPFYLNKSSNFYFINNELNLTNNEDEINEKILQYINNNDDIKQELISKINKNKINKSSKKNINLNTCLNTNNHIFKNINSYKNSIMNIDEELDNPKSYRNNTEFEMNKKSTDNKSLDLIINNNKNNVIYRNKKSKIKPRFYTINENIKSNFNSCNNLNKDNKKINSNSKHIKIYSNLNKNKCDNINLGNKKAPKKPNIISNEINEEFNLKNEKENLYDEDDIFRITMQSLNDSKIFEMASKYVDRKRLVDKKEVNEILNEKNNQQSFKKPK